ncbi:ParB N-terminal domain-containing protein [Aquibium sp. ELW1220]|uniref:DNA modification methylase n=1 Tax=Aquibium sp. ELW1220 TaxID=2976766 RepID=UPI0025B176FC|nr:ParB N-terminal domain-containing protein [Aquibium sp. ELW1220]MDN2579014.1 ParB N-terminal domain-containing protein [Aquibium sp. ELW1220]
MIVTNMPVERLIPYARNPRNNTAAIDAVKASIAEFGFRQPIVVDEKMVVIVGHTRLEAAKALGLATVPVHVAEGLTPAQARAYRLMDNRSHENAEWDDELLKLEFGDLKLDGFDLDLTGFDSDQLSQLLADVPSEGLTDENDVPEAPARAVTRRGDLWILGNHRLLCGDSTSSDDVTRLMNGERAALFATDPPYLVDYDGTNHPTKKNASARARKIANKNWSEEYIEQKHWDDSSQGPQFYEAFMQVAIDCAIAEDAAWYCWHASRRQAMLEACWTKFDVLHHQQIIWAKSRPVLTRSIMLWAHEPCLFGWRSGHKPHINREGFENWPTTVWSIPSSEIETREHPTSKPIKVFTLPMELHTVPGEICYEPFSGSGSQHIAGEKTGRRVYGLELSETFCDVIINRWQAFSGKAAILDGDGRSFDEVSRERVGDDAGDGKAAEQDAA